MSSSARLSVLDRKWREHLYEMDYLKEGIGLRAMAQRDPLVEYKSEGYDMFQAMNDGIKEESVRYLFNFELPSEREEREAAIVSAESAAQAAAEAEAAQRELAAEMAAQTAAESTRKRVDAEKTLGIKTPRRSRAVSYSSASEDGSVQTTDESGRAVRRSASRSGEGASDGMNRAQRRAAARRRKH